MLPLMTPDDFTLVYSVGIQNELRRLLGSSRPALPALEASQTDRWCRIVLNAAGAVHGAGQDQDFPRYVGDEAIDQMLMSAAEENALFVTASRRLLPDAGQVELTDADGRWPKVHVVHFDDFVEEHVNTSFFSLGDLPSNFFEMVQDRPRDGRRSARAYISVPVRGRELGKPRSWVSDTRNISSFGVLVNASLDEGTQHELLFELAEPEAVERFFHAMGIDLSEVDEVGRNSPRAVTARLTGVVVRVETTDQGEIQSALTFEVADQ
jgi:hypothetical protein